jgi:hypothetical protein
MKQGLLTPQALPFQPFTLAPGHLTFNVKAGSEVQNKTLEGADIGKDLLVVLPESNRLRGIQINGGGGEGTCVIIGGSIDLREPGAVTTIRPLTVVGFKWIYIEGLLLRAGIPGQDVMNWGGHTVNGVKARCRMQNCFLGAAEGYEVGEEIHSDCVQATQETERWEIGRLTGESSYQVFIGHGPESPAGPNVGEWDMREVNLRGFNPSGEAPETNGYPVFAHGAGNGYPSHWRDAYIDLGASGRNPVTEAVYPPTTVDAVEGFKSNDGGKTLVPVRAGSTGLIHVSPPPGGDFVLPADVGVGYVNTVGYR